MSDVFSRETVRTRWIDGMEDRAYALGADHGLSAASWYFDGNTDARTYRAVLDGILSVDPAVFDTFPSNPLSGEWADGVLPSDVLEDLGIGEGDPIADQLLDMYCDGYDVAVAREIERACRLHLGEGEGI